MARAYKYITSKTSPNRSSRKGNKIQSITVHWWGNPVGQKIGGIVSWLCDPRARASAHYVISGDTVYCIVDPDQKAWHSGSNKGNLTSIGLELDPNASMRASTERTAAALIADLRSTYGNVPLRKHSSWVSTACPGNWDVNRLDALAKGKGGTVIVKPKPQPLPAKKPSKKGPLEVDGRFGKSTVKALQQFLNARGHDIVEDGRAGEATWKALQVYLGAPYKDGIISRQSHSAKSLGNGIVPGKTWVHTGRNSKGSQTIELLQKWVGVTQDGVLGEKTTAALQRKLNQHGASV